MCGIAGYSGVGDDALLARMLSVMSYRGPDANGRHVDVERRVGLAHLRLSIIDLSPRSNQPLWDVERQACIVFNGEIYNYRELREELRADGFQFSSAGDAEVLLNLYLRDGLNGLRSLNGMFAFAILDTRSDTLVLARDPFGIKPLYYAQHPEGFVFASEIKAVLQVPEISREISLPAVQSMLGLLWIPGPRTVLEAVRKVSPGEVLEVKAGRIAHRVGFLPLPKLDPQEGLSEQEAVDSVREGVKSAVERQLVADVDLGAFLSGGLDSSSVVAFAARSLGPERLSCYTIETGVSGAGDTLEDLPHARRTAAALGVKLHTIRIESSMLEDLPGMVWHLDEPQADPAPLNVWYIARAARERGLKVLLSGSGGDDIFSGYRRHTALTLEPFWSWLPRPARAGLRLSARRAARITGNRRIDRIFRHADLAPRDRLAGYFLWLELAEISRLFSKDAAASAVTQRVGLREDSAVSPLLDTLNEIPDGMAPLNQMLTLDQRYFLPDHNCNYTDKMSMAASIETRVPLLDLELAATAARLPVNFKHRGTDAKWVFKRAMEGILPHETIWRPKSGFGAPIRRWITRDLKSMVDEHLSESNVRARGLWDPAAVSELILRNQQGTVDASYTILGMLCMEYWCQQFIDPALPTRV